MGGCSVDLTQSCEKNQTLAVGYLGFMNPGSVGGLGFTDPAGFFACTGLEPKS